MMSITKPNYISGPWLGHGFRFGTRILPIAPVAMESREISNAAPFSCCNAMHVIASNCRRMTVWRVDGHGPNFDKSKDANSCSTCEFLALVERFVFVAGIFVVQLMFVLFRTVAIGSVYVVWFGPNQQWPDPCVAMFIFLIYVVPTRRIRS